MDYLPRFVFYLEVPDFEAFVGLEFPCFQDDAHSVKLPRFGYGSNGDCFLYTFCFVDDCYLNIHWSCLS